MVRWFVDSFIHCFTGSMIHWFIASLTHRCIDSLFRWFIDSRNHGFMGSLVRRFTDSLVHWVIHSLIRWFADSVVHCFDASLMHWFLDSLTDWFFIDSLTHRPNGSLIHSVSRAWLLSCHVISISTTMCPFVGALHNFNTCLLLHAKTFPIGNLLPIAVLNVRNSRPGTGRALPGHYLVYVCIHIT